MMEEILHPNQPVRCIITAPGNSGKSVFLKKLILNIVNEYDKIYIYSPSLHQDFYQKLFKRFCYYLPIQKVPNIVNEGDTDLVFDELVNNKDFNKSDIEIETYESVGELRHLQNYGINSNIILDDLNEKKINNDKIEAMFQRGRHDKLSIFIFNQDYYELPKITIRANGNIYHIFKPNNFRDVQNVYQDEESTDMTLNKFKFLTSTCWIEKYKPITID